MTSGDVVGMSNHTPVPLSLTVNFSLYCCWGPAVSVSSTLDVNAGLLFSVF